MIYKGYKIEVEVDQYLTYELTDEGRPDPTRVTSQDGWDVTGYYIRNTTTDEEDWLTRGTGGDTLDNVKSHIDKLVEEKNDNGNS